MAVLDSQFGASLGSLLLNLSALVSLMYHAAGAVPGVMSVTCPVPRTASNLAAVNLTVSSVTGTGACTSKQFLGGSFSAAVTITPRPQLSIAGPEDRNVCARAVSVSAEFTYNVSDAKVLTFTAPIGCAEPVKSELVSRAHHAFAT